VNLLESGAKEGDSPVAESLPDSKRYPEYYGTREIPWEAGETTLQG
jgi:hypothetical protein